jgi:hypothetical protein
VGDSREEHSHQFDTAKTSEIKVGMKGMQRQRVKLARLGLKLNISGVFPTTNLTYGSERTKLRKMLLTLAFPFSKL